jgi:hypothetical protein
VDNLPALLPAGAAELVVQRGDDTVGVLVPLKVSVDGAPAGGLMPNRSVAVPVSPGTHVVRAGRSRSESVTVSGGERAYLLALHPPLPSWWRVLFVPSSMHPTIVVVPGPATVPGAGVPTAGHLELERHTKSLAAFSAGMPILWGALMVVVAAVLAVIGRDAGLFLVIPGLLALLGVGGIATGAWLRKRVPAEWRIKR